MNADHLAREFATTRMRRIRSIAWRTLYYSETSSPMETRLETRLETSRPFASWTPDARGILGAKVDRARGGQSLVLRRTIQGSASSMTYLCDGRSIAFDIPEESQ